MFKSRLPIVAIGALSVGMLFAATEVTLAAKAKKLTYEQAWEECKKDVASVLIGDTGTSAARYTRGAACMKKHGYRLKRSDVQ